jgi:hypothetical protein
MHMRIASTSAVLVLLFARLGTAQPAVQGQSEAPGTPTVNIGLDPVGCGSSNRPAWCSGSDLGAWINAAIAHMPGNGSTPSGCGVIQLSYQASAKFTTTIVKPRCTVIDLNQSTIVWAGSSTQAIVVADTYTKAPPSPGGIKNGRIFGSASGISRSNGIFLGGDPAGVIFSAAGNATNQSFYDLDVQNFTDDYVVGNNAFQNTWVNGTIALSGRSGIHFIANALNEGENFNFHGTTFLNNQQHDVLVDPKSFAEVNTNGVSFDYAVGDSISSTGTLLFNASSSHFERGVGGKFFNCSNSCSVSVGSSAMYLMGDASPADAFGQFGSSSRASFVGVDWANVGKSAIKQFFIWNDTSPIGSLYMLNFRQTLGQGAINSVPAYSGSAPTNFSDSRNPMANRAASNQPATNSPAGLTGHATCWKPNGQIGYCSTPLNSSGVCTCN